MSSIDISISLSSQEYAQRLSAAAAGTGRFGQILTGVARVVGDVEDRMTFAAQAADDLARRIEPQTDGFDRLRSNVEALSDRLKIFGERGNQMASAIEGISDPVRRATLAQREFDRLQNPDRLTRMASAANDAQAEFALLTARLGPLAPAIGGVVTGALALAGVLGGALATGWLKFVEQTASGRQNLDEFSKSLDRVHTAAGTLISSGRGLEAGMTVLEVALDSGAEALQAWGEANEWARTKEAELLGPLIELQREVNAHIPLYGRLSEAVYGWMEQGADNYLRRLDENATSLTSTLERLTGGALDAGAALRDGLGGAADSVATSFANLTGQIQDAVFAAQRERFMRTDLATGGVVEGPLTPEGRLEGPPRQKSGGGGAGRSRPEEPARVLGGLSSLMDSLKEKAASFEAPVFEGTALSLQQIEDTLREAGLIEQLNQTGDALYEITNQLRDGFESDAFLEGIENARAMKEVFDDLASGLKDGAVNAFMQLTDASFQAFGAFAVGESSLKKFKDAMLDTVGDIASSFGDLFLKAGAGLFVFDPVGGSILIAAGAALKVGAGAASAKGSANAGGSSSAAREVERIADRLSREGRTDGRQAAPQVLVIGDKEFRGYLYSEVSQAQARRALA